MTDAGEVSWRVWPWRRTKEVIQHAETPPPELHRTCSREIWGAAAAVAVTLLMVLTIYAVLRWSLSSLRCCNSRRDGEDMVLVNRKQLEWYKHLESLYKLPAPAVTEVFLSVAGEVTVAVVERDGDSLFAALAHQLYEEPIGSPDHRQDTDMLRKLAVRSLRKNLQLREEVLQSMAAHGLRYAHLTKEEGVDQFLADLGQPGFPGGRESLRALANITEAHIVVYPEQGHVYEVSSSTTAPLINVSISQRLLTDEQGRTNLQYDSVVEVKPANP